MKIIPFELQKAANLAVRAAEEKDATYGSLNGRTVTKLQKERLAHLDKIIEIMSSMIEQTRALWSKIAKALAS